MGTGTLTLVGSDTLANHQAALRAVTYVNTSDNPSVLARTVSFTVNDGTASSVAATRNITVTAVNDAPVATITPVSYAATEQTSVTLKNTGISCSDVDAGSGAMPGAPAGNRGTLTVSAGHRRAAGRRRGTATGRASSGGSISITGLAPRSRCMAIS